MNKHSGKISGCLVILIIILVAAAVGLSMNNGANDMVDDYYSEDVSKQISLEIKKGEPLVNHSVAFEGVEKDETEEMFYIVRLNHDVDMELKFKVDVKTKDKDMLEKLRLKVYDSTNDAIICDDVLKNIDGKVYEELKLANASNKSDTRYEMTLYFGENVDDSYKGSDISLNFSWYVSDKNADDLLHAKTGEVKWILYAFLIGGALMVVLFFFGRKHMNPEVFMTPEERGVNNGFEDIGNTYEKKKK